MLLYFVAFRQKFFPEFTRSRNFLNNAVTRRTNLFRSIKAKQNWTENNPKKKGDMKGGS